jgi:hypothetical protein
MRDTSDNCTSGMLLMSITDQDNTRRRPAVSVRRIVNRCRFWTTTCISRFARHASRQYRSIISSRRLLYFSLLRDLMDFPLHLRTAMAVQFVLQENFLRRHTRFKGLEKITGRFQLGLIANPHWKGRASFLGWRSKWMCLV